MFGNHHILEADTIESLTDSARKTISSIGHPIPFSDNHRNVCHNVTLTLTNPANTKGRYPFWDIDSEDWYISNFISSAIAPEEHQHKYIFPFTYSWRTQFHDNGWGHVVALVELLQALNYDDLSFERADDLLQLVRETYHAMHPDLVLAVMAWLKRENLMLFLINNQIPQEILKSNRKNLLDTIVQQLLKTPMSDKAITPSLMYGAIDTYGILEHTPHFHSYQVMVKYDQQLNPLGIETYRFQRSTEIGPFLQLNLAHDLYLGKLIADQLQLPHLKSTLYTNLLFSQELNMKTKPLNVKEAVLQSMGGYEPKNYNLEPYISTPKFHEKINRVIKLFNQING